MSLEELEARIKVLEDIEEIEKLMASYAYWVDAFQMDDVVGLFAENAKAEYGPLGSYEGKDGITTFFKEVVPNTQSWSAHQLRSPIVTVEGEKAAKTIEFRTTVKASAAWGWIGIGIIVVVIGGLFGLFRWLGRR